jgi:hypothetical protein
MRMRESELNSLGTGIIVIEGLWLKIISSQVKTSENRNNLKITREN